MGGIELQQAAVLAAHLLLHMPVPPVATQMEKAIRLPVHRDVKRPFEADDMIALVRRAAITAGLGVSNTDSPSSVHASRKAAMSLICVLIVTK